MLQPAHQHGTKGGRHRRRLCRRCRLYRTQWPLRPLFAPVMSPLLSAEGLGVVRQDKTILRDVSLDIGERDFVTIIGPNGAGKSTLIKCLVGIEAASSGRVIRQRGLRLGYLPQRLGRDASMPITTRRFLQLRRRTTRAQLDEVAATCQIEALLTQSLHHLSGGEMQRVLLARALLGDPQLLVMDEPAQNLDVDAELAFYHLINGLHDERGIAMLMVSHDLHMVMASTRRVVCLYQHVCCSGEPQAVARDPEFIALFGEEMAQTMAVYPHVHDHHHD
ncbi:unnamed protein product [Cyprideis torosa]|uniref:Uncharacterized protein n=1 Tax=Cyprideis torosa TaxID=163714 RepID=A0A7R8WZW3_9CRUS|nr:unnamed protein product [Cyprideis torosa]CAG0910233.1 unnamed protein product [Cyprideis torosa]